jgi:glycosyltransferase involved in cell wall biosynthesis
MGGAERQVLALASRMADRGHAVALLVLRPRLTEEWPTDLDVLHLDLRKTPFSVVAATFLAHRFLRGFRPQIVHSHGFHGNLFARLLRATGHAPAPISTIHNVYEGGWMRMMAYRITDPLSLHTTAVSQAASERFVQLKAVPKRKCSVVANGIDTREFAPDSKRRSACAAQMEAGESFVWLAAGRIVPAKDYPNLLRAFAQVRATGLDPQLWIAGDASPSEAANMKAFTAELGLSPAVRWLGLRRDISGLLDAADGFVLSSAWEGMPLAIGEAMAMEKPIVATDVGGVRELVGNAGTLVPARDPTALAYAMLAVMRTTACDRQSLGRAARERIVRDFSMEARAVEWESIYRNSIDRFPNLLTGERSGGQKANTA